MFSQVQEAGWIEATAASLAQARLIEAALQPMQGAPELQTQPQDRQARASRKGVLLQQTLSKTTECTRRHVRGAPAVSHRQS